MEIRIGSAALAVAALAVAPLGALSLSSKQACEALVKPVLDALH